MEKKITNGYEFLSNNGFLKDLSLSNYFFRCGLSGDFEKLKREGFIRVIPYFDNEFRRHFKIVTKDFDYAKLKVYERDTKFFANRVCKITQSEYDEILKSDKLFKQFPLKLGKAEDVWGIILLIKKIE